MLSTQVNYDHPMSEEMHEKLLAAELYFGMLGKQTASRDEIIGILGELADEFQDDMMLRIPTS